MQSELALEHAEFHPDACFCKLCELDILEHGRHPIRLWDGFYIRKMELETIPYQANADETVMVADISNDKD